MANFDDKGQSKKIQEIQDLEEESFVERISSKFNLPYINLAGVVIETDALITLAESEARASGVAPFKIVGKELYVGVRSPKLAETKKTLESLSEKYTLGVHMISQKSLEKAWSRYADISQTQNTQGGMLDISPDELLRLAQQIQTNDDIAIEFQKVMADTSNRKTTQLMEVIFGGAIATKSSDVHIEAQDKQVRLRFRQDGVLQDITSFDHESYQKLLSRIKLLSEMKLTQHENAQDGRFTIDFDGKEIEVRVSVVPSAYGESFVMRILNPDGINVGIEDLGIEPKLYEILMREIKKPNGMILTTGPTGSGKTTTLYSFLKEVYTSELKILTIEDPIEYHLKGISQTQINKDKGYTFLSGLRAALRQDPDVIMVGEIRDKETATIAVNASLTGHLVLSTLHTNGAAGVIPRLIDLGVSPQILAAALSVSIAQRLVRKVCSECRYQEQATPSEEQLVRDILIEAERHDKKLSDYGVSVGQDIILTKGKGCSNCNETGYKGRIGIFEAIITDELIEELLNKKPSEQDVRRVAQKQGLLNIREDGIIKVLNGVTSLSEIQSVVDLDIKNITQEDSPPNKEVPAEKKTILSQDPQTIDTQREMNPQALLNDNSVEVSLLMDYLQQLEHQQTIDPDINVSQKIKTIEHTIVQLLRDKNAEQIFKNQNLAAIHEQLKEIEFELSQLREHQVQQDNLQTAPKLKQIKEDIKEII